MHVIVANPEICAARGGRVKSRFVHTKSVDMTARTALDVYDEE